MKYKLAVKGIIRREGGEILILKRNDDDSFNPGIWETVGGAMDNDASPQEALKREIMEETGIEVKINEPFNVFTFINETGETKIGITFLCDYLSGEIVLSHEHCDYKWIKAGLFKDFKSIIPLHNEISSYYNKFTTEHEKFSVSQKAILIRNGKCLIVEINKRLGTWDLPGGRIDVGENKEEAFRREIREELGINNFQVIATVHHDAWHTSLGFAVCGIVSLIESDEEITLSNEHTRYIWIDESEINNYKYIWPQMAEMISRAFILAKLKKTVS